MGHVVDEIVFDFRISFLTEDDNNGEQEGNKQDDGKDDAGNHKTYRGENVRIHLWKVNLHHTHLRLRVIAKESLLVCYLTSLFLIIWTTIYLTPIRS